MVEYAVTLALVAIVVVAMLVALGEKVSNTIGNTATTLGSLDTEPELAVHVGGISLSVNTSGQVKVTGIVTVLDQDGDAVSGATVSASWFLNGALVINTSDGTDGQGRARFRYMSGEIEEGDVVRLVVTYVSASDCEYDSDSNVESAEEIVIPED